MTAEEFFQAIAALSRLLFIASAACWPWVAQQRRLFTDGGIATK